MIKEPQYHPSVGNEMNVSSPTVESLGSISVPAPVITPKRSAEVNRFVEMSTQQLTGSKRSRDEIEALSRAQGAKRQQ